MPALLRICENNEYKSILFHPTLHANYALLRASNSNRRLPFRCAKRSDIEMWWLDRAKRESEDANWDRATTRKQTGYDLRHLSISSEIA